MQGKENFVLLKLLSEEVYITSDQLADELKIGKDISLQDIKGLNRTEMDFVEELQQSLAKKYDKSARQLEINIYRKNFEAYLQISQYVCRQQRNDVPVLILE